MQLLSYLTGTNTQMAKFTVRIELHNASPEDYARLHESMAMNGFNREILSGEGVRFKLPNAEYAFEGELALKEMLEKAKLGARPLGIKFTVLVTESKGRVWYGLEKA